MGYLGPKMTLAYGQLNWNDNSCVVMNGLSGLNRCVLNMQCGTSMALWKLTIPTSTQECISCWITKEFCGCAFLFIILEWKIPCINHCTIWNRISDIVYEAFILIVKVASHPCRILACITKGDVLRITQIGKCSCTRYFPFIVTTVSNL